MQERGLKGGRDKLINYKKKSPILCYSRSLMTHIVITYTHTKSLILCYKRPLMTHITITYKKTCLVLCYRRSLMTHIVIT